MTKADIIKAIEVLEIYHKEQLSKIAQLIDGYKVKNLTPLNKEECEFGRWLYGEGKSIESLLGLQFYNNIELMHSFWHDEYKKIYEIFYDTKKNTLLKFCFGCRKKSISGEMSKKAKEYFRELQAITQNLLKALTVSKTRLLALNESAFA